MSAANLKLCKNKTDIIYGTVYPYDVCVSTVRDFKKLKAYLQTILPEEAWNEIDDGLASDDGRTIQFSTGQTIIQINKPMPGVIAHEVFHAVSFLMLKLMTPLTMDTNEVYAYLVQYLTDEIYKRFVI